MNSHWLRIKQLDEQLKEWQTINNKYGRPKIGWIKTLRKALNIPVNQLAKRLGVSRARISQLENAEIHDAVTLRTLSEAANAIECQLVYAIIPKNHNTLESIIRTQTEQIATESVARVAHSMSLEKQTVNPDILKKQKDDLVKNLMEHLHKKIWIDSEVPHASLQKNKNRTHRTLREKLTGILQKKK